MSEVKPLSRYYTRACSDPLNGSPYVQSVKSDGGGWMVLFEDYEALRQRAEQAEADRDDARAGVTAFGDKVCDMMEQMERGNWKDDHDHDVKMNAAMLSLLGTLSAAITKREGWGKAAIVKSYEDYRRDAALGRAK